MTTGGPEDIRRKRLVADLVGLFADHSENGPTLRNQERARLLSVRTLEENIIGPTAAHRAAHPEALDADSFPEAVKVKLMRMVGQGPGTMLGGLTTLIDYGLHQREQAARLTGELARTDGELAEARQTIERLEQALTDAHGTIFDLGPDPVGEEAALDAAAELAQMRRKLEEQ